MMKKSSQLMLFWTTKITSTPQSQQLMSKTPSGPNIQLRSWSWVSQPSIRKKVPLFFYKLGVKVDDFAYYQFLRHHVVYSVDNYVRIQDGVLSHTAEANFKGFWPADFWTH